jgi:hypothetical protein
MLHVEKVISLALDEVNAPVPVNPPPVVVAVSPPESEAFVPHAKPCWVALEPPVAVMFPLRVAVVGLV